MSYNWRRFKDKLALSFGVLCIMVAMVPLASILIEVVKNGIFAFTVDFFTQHPGAVGQPGGGIANAIQGTLILMALSSLIGIPFGLISGIYLAEYGNNRLGRSVRFLNDVLTQFPSIVVGILVATLVARTFSALAGGFALSIIMIPTVTRATEESIKLVPSSIRDAAMALGIRKWRATFSIVLSTARAGIITGILLAIARVSGETAPLILTVFGSEYFATGLNQPIDALPLEIWKNASLPYTYAQQQGWGAALVLILIVLGLNIGVRVATRGRYNMLRTRI